MPPVLGLLIVPKKHCRVLYAISEDTFLESRSQQSYYTSLDDDDDDETSLLADDDDGESDVEELSDEISTVYAGKRRK